MSYIDRVVDDELRRRLDASGAVVIEGPKAVGKTETARQVAASFVLLDVDLNAQQALAVDPSLVLEGATPRLIDEWQIEPTVWNHVRRLVDQRQVPGQFILTGSSVPDDDRSRHTGAGRFSFLRMRPMSLYETGHSNGSVSLSALIDATPPRATDAGLTVSQITDRIVVGGWPAHVRSKPADAARANRDYLTQIRQVDVARVGGPRRDPAKVGQLLRSLARNVGTEAAVTVLASDVGGSEGPIDRNTIADYLDILERLMITENQPAWAPHLRSKAVLRSSAKRHFVDPSLAVAALGASSTQLLNDLTLLGFLFESQVIHDLRVYAQPMDANVLHYRDSNGLEVDAIIQLADGRWAAFEVKLATTKIDDGAASLRKFAATIDTTRSGKPAALAVITSTGYAYTHPDGIHVIPIGTLGP